MNDKQQRGRERLMRMLAQHEYMCYENQVPCEEDFLYSNRYIRAINKLIKCSQKSSPKLSFTHRKRVAVIGMTLFLVIGLSLTTYAMRKPLSMYLQSWFSDTFVQEKVYAPKYIPMDFELQEYYQDDTSMRMLFYNKKQDEIIFSQSAKDSWNREIENFNVFYINHTEIATYEEENRKIYIWSKDNQVFQYTFPIFFLSEECIKIIEKTQPHEKGKECLCWESISRNCTQATYCILCNDVLSAAEYKYHDVSEIVIDIGDPLYHKVTCRHTTVSGIPCEANLLEVHNFSNEKCVDCGYQGGK